MVTRWKTRLPTFNQKFLSFNSTHQFRHWFECGGQLEDNLLFVFDYHLDGDNTGLAIINNLGISKESILVTSAYMDEDVLSNAIRLNVRVMPKILV